MPRKRKTQYPDAYGKPTETLIQDRLLDANYRKHYMLYRVRAEIAVTVKSLRRTKNMTQKALAQKSGIPQSQIARLESLEDARIPGLDQLVRIFSALDSRAFLEIFPAPNSQSNRKEIVLV